MSDALNHPPLQGRREKKHRWVCRGQYAVEVQIDVVYPTDYPHDAYLETPTLKFLREVACRAEKGDLEYLRTVGRVFQAVA